MDGKWQKSSPKLVETFDRVVPKVAGVEMRKMFGYPCAFVNDIWFMGTFQENDLVLKLSDEDRTRFLAMEGARQFEPMPGRPMKEMIMVPQWMMDDEAELCRWIDKSLAYASSLPRKPAKKKKG